MPFAFTTPAQGVVLFPNMYDGFDWAFSLSHGMTLKASGPHVFHPQLGLDYFLQ